MKRVCLTVLTICIGFNLFAQVPVDIINRFNLVIKLIKEGNSNKLANLIQYPLKRQNPLPDIANAGEFISYNPQVFDAAFEIKLQHFKSSDIIESNGRYGLVGGVFDGDIWITEDGKIVAINYSPKAEIIRREQLTKKIQSEMYPTVNSWAYNLIVGKSNNLLIRVDDTSKGIRYVSWSKNKPTSEKPDLILFNGVAQPQGTMGGWTWTFKSGDWTYVVDDVEMCEDGSADCGLFLRLLYKDVEKSTIRLKQIK